MTYVVSSKASHKSKAQPGGDLRWLKEAAAEINKTKASAREFLIKNGFVTKSGQLAKRYR